MVSLNRLKGIVDRNLNNREKIKMMIDMIEDFQLGWYDEKMIIVNESYYDDFHYSSSIIELRDHSAYESYLNDYVLDQLDKQQTIHLIVDAINNICLKEDKKIFVERFILRQKMGKIKKDHCLSNNGYYQCLDRAINDCYKYIEEHFVIVKGE